jgi:hypothetical protein
MEEAWGAFCKGYESMGPKGTPEDREQQWFAILAKLFPGRQPRELSAVEWGVMRDQGPGEIIPF